MATSASWSTLPGVIESYRQPHKQLKLLSISTVTFAASLRHWKFTWLPEELPEIDSSHDKDRGWVVESDSRVDNAKKEGEASLDGGASQQEGAVKGRKGKKELESLVMTNGDEKYSLRELETEGHEITYTSGGKTEVINSTQVGDHRCLVFVSAIIQSISSKTVST